MASGAPINKIERAHQMYREGSYEEALVFYTDALSMAKTKSQKIAIHSNRAACYLKLHHFDKAAEECTSVLDLDHKHTGALMLRAQTLVTLKEYQSALFDVNRLIDLNPSSEVYQNLQSRLKTQLSLAPIPEAETELEDDEDIDEAEQKEEEEDEQVEVEPETHEDKDGGQVEGGELEQDAVVVKNQNTENGGGISMNEVITLQTLDHSQKAEKVTDQSQSLKESAEQNSSGWQTVPKPKGHSHLDYSRWDRVEDDSSDDDDDEEDEETKPQYRFRVRTVGVRPVK